MLLAWRQGRRRLTRGRVMRSSRTRGEDDAGPALASDQQRVLDAIRRQLDAEFGEGEHPGRSMSGDAPRRGRSALRRARRRPRWGLIATLVTFALGGAAGMLGTAAYLRGGDLAHLTSRAFRSVNGGGDPGSPRIGDAAVAPTSSPPAPVAPPARAERAAPPASAAAPSTGGQPASDSEEVPPAPGASAGAGQSGPEVRSDPPPSTRAGALSLPPRPTRPVSARNRTPSESRSRDARSR